MLEMARRPSILFRKKVLKTFCKYHWKLDISLNTIHTRNLIVEDSK